MALSKKEIMLAINKAFSFMASGQYTHKILLTEVSSHSSMIQSSRILSVYIPTYILHSLNTLGALIDVSMVTSEIVEFLTSQMENQGIWRFFGKNKQFPPTDFDDTCCALAALKENNIEVDTAVWNYLIMRKSTSGLYYTWIDDEMNRRSLFHTDMGVNINILYFAALYRRKFVEIIKHINLNSVRKTFCIFSIYSVSDYGIIYLISRAYSDSKVVQLKPAIIKIVDYLTSSQSSNGNWGNSLDTALALTSLLNAGYTKDPIFRAAKYLLEYQKKSFGGFESYAFFRDLTPRYYGSPYLTTAIFLEAMTKLLSLKMPEIEHN